MPLEAVSPREEWAPQHSELELAEALGQEWPEVAVQPPEPARVLGQAEPPAPV